MSGICFPGRAEVRVLLPIQRTDGRSTAASRMDAFEAVRGLACLAVLVSHIILAFWPGLYYRNGPRWDPIPFWLQLLAQFPGKFLWDGHMAVRIFFVLSGFVLSLTFFQGGSAASLRSAVVRRYPRLMLPAAASILLAYFLLQSGAICNHALVRFLNETAARPAAVNAPPDDSIIWLVNLYNFPPHFRSALREGVWGVFAAGSSYNVVLWTMKIELLGSFLVYGFLALFGRLDIRWLLYGLCVGLCLACEEYFYLNFLLGMAACDLWVHNQRTWRKSLPLGPALLLLAVGVFLMPWKPLAGLLVVGATAAAPRLQQLLGTRWLAFLGRLSFSLYLVHLPIVCSLGCGLYLFLCRDLGWPLLAGSLAAGLASLVGSFLTAWLFYHGVDRPTIALTRQLSNWLYRPNAIVEPAGGTARAQAA